MNTNWRSSVKKLLLHRTGVGTAEGRGGVRGDGEPVALAGAAVQAHLVDERNPTVNVAGNSRPHSKGDLREISEAFTSSSSFGNSGDGF